MRKAWRPLVLFACVAGAAFALSLASVFEPEAPSAGPVALGDAYRGELLFEERCSSCHGQGGAGGGVGPVLAGSGLKPSFVKMRIEQGAGAMPAGLATGAELADLVAYVAQIAGQ